MRFEVFTELLVTAKVFVIKPNKETLRLLVRTGSIPTEWSQQVGEVSDNFCP